MSKFHIIRGLIVCVLAWIFFLIFPNLDLILSSYFYNPSYGFVANNNYGIFGVLHKFVKIFPILFSIIIILFLLGTFFIKRLKIKNRKFILFLALCLWIGPGLIVNVLFKDHWGRPRPYMIEQFHGSKVFQQPFVISNECFTNCSFPCGDASIGFWFFALMPIVVTRKNKIISFLVTILAGGSLGLMRMAQGGHFFSDVIFCGIFVYLCTWIVYWIMYENNKILNL